MEIPYDKDSKERLPYEHYLEKYQNMDPEEMAKRTNLPWDAEKKTFTIRLMSVTYSVSWPEYEVHHMDHDEMGFFPLEDAFNARILILRYMVDGGAVPATGKFLTYREVPWGQVYFKQFQGRCLMRLAYGFGSKLDVFRRVMEQLGATPVKTGDAGFEFEFINDLKLRFMLWEGDDEFPPASQILFSDNFPAAFVMGEDMAVVGDVSINVIKALSSKK